MGASSRAPQILPGLTLKAWIHVNTAVSNGASVIISSGGVTSAVRSGVGTFTVTFAANMATANYAVVADGHVSTGPVVDIVSSRLVGSCVMSESANRDWVGWVGFYE